MSTEGRKEVLDAASKAVLSDRNRVYGNPEDNFKEIAELWTWYTTNKGVPGWKFSALDVAHMMVLMKMARLKHNPTHFDSVVDVAGYAACAADCFPPAPKQSSIEKSEQVTGAVTPYTGKYPQAHLPIKKTNY
jgi:hypothetical protein